MARSSQEKARRYLTDLIAAQRDRNERCLPPLREMVSRSGISYVTLHRALKALIAQGAVFSVARGGYVITGMPSIPEPPPEPSPPTPPLKRIPRRQHVARQIIHDMTTGRLPARGRLPSCKQLCGRYGTSYSTLQEALHLLVQWDVIRPYGRGYDISRPARPASSSCVYLLAPWDEMSALAGYTPRTLQFLWEIEQECRRAGLMLRVCSYRRATVEVPWFDGSARDILQQHRDSNVLGYVALTSGSKSSPVFHQVLDLLIRSQKPVGIMDEMGWAPEKNLPRGRFRIFHTGHGSAPGLEVGRYLIRLGHRHIAFFGDLEHNGPALDRYNGINEAMAEAGLSTRCVSIGLERQITEEERRKVSRTERMLTRMKDAMERFETQLDEVGDDIIRPAYPYTLPGIRALHRGSKAVLCKPRFEEALSDRRLTAWVCYSDQHATAALHFLQNSRVPVPQELSVVGFDNTSEASLNGLTSYSFNIPGVVRAIVDHILKGETRRTRAYVQQIPGFIAVRQSTAAPARIGDR